MHVMIIALVAAMVPLPAFAQIKVIKVPPHPFETNQNIQPPYLLPHSTDTQKSGDNTYHPEVGQAGKDALWVPTPSDQIVPLLKFAGLKPHDYLIDLGSGDGRLPIEAARIFGARALGIEFNEDMVALARRNAARANVQNRARFLQGDVLQSDFSQATIITFYLQPALNLKLRERFMQMRPGTRLLAHTFDLGAWRPDARAEIGPLAAYLWIVPARIDGRWAFEVGDRRFIANITQKYQMVSAQSDTLSKGRIRGRHIRLALQDGERLEGEINGDEMWGSGWSAIRIHRK